jgi:sugar phosphate isomerase/epimerase
VLGMRDLQLGRLLDRLAEAGYTGPFVLELTVPEALESL